MAYLRERGVDLVDLLNSNDSVVRSFAKKDAYVTPFDYGAKGDGVQDDTSAIQDAIDQLPDGGLLRLPRTTNGYLVGSDGVGLHVKRIRGIIGEGKQSFTKLKAAAGLAEPLLSIDQSAQHNYGFLNRFFIDMTLAPTQTALYATLCQFWNLEDIQALNAAVAFDFDQMNACDYTRLFAINPRTAGIRLKNTLSTQNDFDECTVYVTSGATVGCTALYDFTDAGSDIKLTRCHALRAPGNAAAPVNFGFRVQYTGANTFADVEMIGCEADGITDLTGLADSQAAAAFYIKNTKTFRMIGCWSSSAPASDGVANRVSQLRIDGGSDHTYLANIFNGFGIEFVNAPDDIKFGPNTHTNSNADALFVMPGANPPTNLVIAQGNRAVTGTLSNDLVKLAAAGPQASAGNIVTAFQMFSSDADAFHMFGLVHPSTGKRKFFRVNNGATGTLELLADNGTTKIMTLGDSGQPTFPAGGIVTGLATPAYSASITPNAANGNWHTITVTNATAFTINAPNTAPTASTTQEITIEILNSSGGAMGVVTWNAIFVLVGGAFTNPATTKKRFITFQWNGSAWIEKSRASADY